MMKGFYIRIPGSIGNVGPGFDALGLAIQMYLQLWTRPADSLQIQFTGIDAERFDPEHNRFLESLNYALQSWGMDAPNLEITLFNEIPMERGLGGSGAATLAGLALASLVARKPLDPAVILPMALAFESHLDNVCSSFLGGLVACYSSETHPVLCFPARVPRSLHILILWPPESAKTRMMRSVLPQSYPKEIMIRQFQRIACLVAYWSREKELPPIELFHDESHQPYRLKHLPETADILTLAQTHGIPGVLSGSGPTAALFALNPKDFVPLLHELHQQERFHRWRWRTLRVDRFGCITREVDLRQHRRLISEPQTGNPLSQPITDEGSTGL